LATNVTFNGSTFSIPSEGDSNWGDALSNYFIAIAAGTLQKTGGNFVLTSEVNFGASFGLRSPYFKTQATNPAGSGNFRLGNTEAINWRKSDNSGDVSLLVDSSNNLLFNGANVFISGGTLLSNADISASAAISLSKLAVLGSNFALMSDSSGIISISSITSTELGNLSGVSSNIQSQISSINTSLSGKEPTISTLPVSKGGTGSSSALSNNRLMKSSGGNIIEAAAITASMALVSDSNGIPIHSSVTSTELGYLSGVSSGIQSQFSGKLSLSTYSAKGSLIAGTGAGTASNLSVGVNNQVLVADSAQSTGVKWADLTSTINFYPPQFYEITSGTGSIGNCYVFRVSSSNATVGAVYTHNGGYFTVLQTISSGSYLVCITTDPAPLSSGTLTKNSGTGDTTISFSAYVAPAYLRVRMVGGGGGGGGGGASGGTGGNGGSTTFGSSLLTANGGNGGSTNTNSGGSGGSASIAYPSYGQADTGGTGGSGTSVGLSSSYASGGFGANSPFMGAGPGSGSTNLAAATSARANSGSGGGGGGVNPTTSGWFPGSGGGAGGYIDAIIPGPLANNYSFTIGAAGTAGTAGTSGFAGGAGGGGRIQLWWHFQ